MSEAFRLTEDQELFRKEWRRLFEDKFTERAAEIDRTAEFPWDNYETLRAAGLLGLNIPEEYGGGGADALTHCLLVEEVARVCASTSLIPAVNKLATLPILFAGTPEQQARFLPRIADGTTMASYCLTEPGSGSDAAALSSRAERDGDDYVINGTKRFVTGGGVSKDYIYYAVSDTNAGSRTPCPGSRSASTRTSWVCAARPPPRSSARTCASPPPTASATRARASRWRSARSTTAASPSAPRPSASPRAPWTSRAGTSRSGASSASRSRSSRGCSSCWPTWPCRPRRPAR